MSDVACLIRVMMLDTDQSVGPHDVRCRVGERIWTEAPARATIFISEVSRASHVTRDRHSDTCTWSDRRSSGPHLVSSEMLTPVCCHMRLVFSPDVTFTRSSGVIIIIYIHFGQQEKSDALLKSL